MDKQQLIKEFVALYGGSEDDVRVFASPGRVNLIGEHTDYNGGFVFPAALTMKTTIVARKRNDNKIVLRATDLPDVVEADIDNLNNYTASAVKIGLRNTGHQMLYVYILAPYPIL